MTKFHVAGLKLFDLSFCSADRQKNARSLPVILFLRKNAALVYMDFVRHAKI